MQARLVLVPQTALVIRTINEFPNLHDRKKNYKIEKG
jgi:hypothetical protein